MQNELYTRELGRYHPTAVKLACEQAAREFDTFPTLKRLLPLVDDEQRRIEDRAALGAPGSKAEFKAKVDTAMNEALGYLANGHLREIDRLSYEDKRTLLIDLGKWWLDRKPPFDPLQFGREHDWRPRCESITEFVERRLGKSLVRILDEENAIAEQRFADFRAKRGIYMTQEATSLQETLNRWRSRTKEAEA